MPIENKTLAPSGSSLIALTAAAAGTFLSGDQFNESGRGVTVVADITVATTTSVVFTIQGKDVASGQYYDLLASAAKTTVTTTALMVYPGAVASANLIANGLLPRIWRVKAVVTGGTSALTATVGASLAA